MHAGLRGPSCRGLQGPRGAEAEGLSFLVQRPESQVEEDGGWGLENTGSLLVITVNTAVCEALYRFGVSSLALPHASPQSPWTSGCTETLQSHLLGARRSAVPTSV